MQYAHARIASVLRKAGEERSPRRCAEARPRPQLHPAERALVKKLLAFPRRSPRRPSAARRTAIATYALELAQEFTAFYRDCQVVGEPERVVPAGAVGRHAADDRPALDLLGVSAPDEM